MKENDVKWQELCNKVCNCNIVLKLQRITVLNAKVVATGIEKQA